MPADEILPDGTILEDDSWFEDPDSAVEVTRQRAPFTMVKRSVLEDESLSMTQKMVYIALCYFADYETGELKAHRKTVAKIASCNVRTLDRALLELEKSGYIAVEKRTSTGKYRLSNIYTLLDFWKDEPNRRGDTESPPEKTVQYSGNFGDRRGDFKSPPGDTESQSLNESVLNKKEEEGEAKHLGTSRSRATPEEPPPPLIPSEPEPGIDPVSRLETFIRHRAPGFYVKDDSLMTLIRAFDKKYGTKALERVVRDYLDEGKSAKDIKLYFHIHLPERIADYEAELTRASSHEPPRCKSHDTLIINGCCEKCEVEKQDGFFPDELKRAVGLPAAKDTA